MAEVISIGALRPGMVIVRVTAQNGPVKIRKSGLVSSHEMIQGLAEMGVLEVEIDPAQTVEIEQPVIPKSKTQQLLDREDPSTSGFDHQLSEQFNRSLFLPSVQELPSSFQVHFKQGMTFALVILGGFALGWTGANEDKWLSLLQQSAVQVTQATPEEPMTQGDNVQLGSVEAHSASPAMPEGGQSATGQDTQQMNLALANQDTGVGLEQPAQSMDTLDETSNEPEPLILGYRPDLEQSDNTNAADQVNQGVSAELLRRFEQAVAQLDSEPQQDYTRVDVDQPDVPMIHELPAWVLTELPSMAFSAHMYASSPNERWIRVNGKRVEEGQQIEEGLQLVSIEPQHVVLAFKGQTFSMEALTDW